MQKRAALAASALLLLAALPLFAEKVSQLKPEGYVNDFAGMLSGPARAQLTALCQEVDQKTNAQIAIVTVHTLEGVPIEEFSINLATRWGIGPKKSDRGVLVLLATDDRKYRIEGGYGLEGILPDGRVGGFGREAVPLLRAGDYDGAVLLITRLIAVVIAEDRGVSLETAPAIPAESATSPASRGIGNLPPGALHLNPASGALMLLFMFLGGALIVTFPFIILFGILRLFGVRPHFVSGSGGSGSDGGSWGSGSSGGGGSFGGGSFGGGGASGNW
jgi:uncharacterized protein